MPRKTSRKFTNHSKQYEEEQENGQQYQQFHQQSRDWQHPESEVQHSGSNENKVNDSDSVIADMAQGFMQAQAAIADKAMSFNNLEIGLLLQKVNEQLEEIKRSNATSAPKGEQETKSSAGQETMQQNTAGKETQDSSKQQGVSGSSEELQALLASVLQGQNNNGTSDNKSAKTENNDVKKSNGGKSPPNMTAVQTVSQVLAQAQYELANELETSLKKLKQVISESEKLANDISKILGEETMKKS